MVMVLLLIFKEMNKKYKKMLKKTLCLKCKKWSNSFYDLFFLYFSYYYYYYYFCLFFIIFFLTPSIKFILSTTPSLWLSSNTFTLASNKPYILYIQYIFVIHTPLILCVCDVVFH